MDLDKPAPAKPTLLAPWLVFAAMAAALIVVCSASAMLGLSMPRTGWSFPPDAMPAGMHTRCIESISTRCTNRDCAATPTTPASPRCASCA